MDLEQEINERKERWQRNPYGDIAFLMNVVKELDETNKGVIEAIVVMTHQVVMLGDRIKQLEKKGGDAI